jgi:hypothetical protein
MQRSNNKKQIFAKTITKIDERKGNDNNGV